MSLDADFLEADNIVKYIINYGYSRVRKTVRSTIRGLGMEEIAEDIF
jgi:hypothetical protein